MLIRNIQGRFVYIIIPSEFLLEFPVPQTQLLLLTVFLFTPLSDITTCTWIPISFLTYSFKTASTISMLSYLICMLQTLWILCSSIGFEALCCFMNEYSTVFVVIYPMEKSLVHSKLDSYECISPCINV